MVGDVHRTLLYGGIFGYPGDLSNPTGKDEEGKEEAFSMLASVSWFILSFRAAYVVRGLEERYFFSLFYRVFLMGSWRGGVRLIHRSSMTRGCSLQSTVIGILFGGRVRGLLGGRGGGEEAFRGKAIETLCCNICASCCLCF